MERCGEGSSQLLAAASDSTPGRILGPNRSLHANNDPASAILSPSSDPTSFFDMLVICGKDIHVSVLEAQQHHSFRMLPVHGFGEPNVSGHDLGRRRLLALLCSAAGLVFWYPWARCPRLIRSVIPSHLFLCVFRPRSWSSLVAPDTPVRRVMTNAACQDVFAASRLHPSATVFRSGHS